MASSSQVREWWAGYQRNTAKYDPVYFPMSATDTIALQVADKSVPVWKAVAQIMASEPYYFLEMAGGTYNPRTPESQSLHTFALALDLNPKKNPMKNPPQHNYPASFIERVEGIRANGKQAIMWGGRWPASNPPDTMHWQINCSPADCQGSVTWDKGDDVDGPNGEPNWDEVSDWAQKAWTQAHQAGILTDSSHPRDSLEVEQLMVYLDRAKVI